MKQLIGRAARRLAPNTLDGLHDLDIARARFGSLEQQLAVSESERAELRERVTQLEAEIDELRRNAPRIAELYDLVFTRLGERPGSH